MLNIRRVLAASLVVAAWGMAEPTTIPADPTPTQAVELVLKAAAANDIDAANDFSYDPDLVTAGNFRRMVKDAADGNAPPRFDGEAVDIDVAVVRLQDYSGGSPRTRYVPVLHTDAGWRVVMKRPPAAYERRLMLLRDKLPPAHYNPSTAPAMKTPPTTLP